MASRRKQRAFRAEQLPDYVKTADSREGSLLASSPKILKQHEERRGAPILVPETVRIRGMHRYSKTEIMDLRVDQRYQREEVTLEVNKLIHVLKKGGMIPDPISVAVRKYGDGGKYIVDGQQRWWAHVDTGTPLNAIDYEVHSYEDEVKLFHALNSQVRVNPEKRLESLPGPAGDTLRRLNTSEASPLRGKITYGTSAGPTQYGSVILLRGLTSLISNTVATGGLDILAPRFDRYYKQAPKLADRMIDAYASLVSQISDGHHRFRPVLAIALGRVCYAAWTADITEMEMPTGRMIQRLRATNWDSLTPSHAAKWVPTVIETITNIWPIDLVKENKEDRKVA